MSKWAGKWDGGRFYLDGKRAVYVLEKMHRGQRYVIALDARNEEEADEQLRAFKADPVAFKAKLWAAPSHGAGLYITAETIQEVLEHQKREGQAKDHRYATGLYLAKWAKVFAGREVSTITVPECETQLVAWKTARKLRITALKTFCTYYAAPARGKLDPTKNPAAQLKIKKQKAAKHTSARHYEIYEIERAYAASDSQVQRDILRMEMVTGCHTTEIERFAAGAGSLREVDPETGCGEIAGVIWFHHKNGELHPNAVDSQTFKAAQRIRERGRIPNKFKRNEFCHRVAKKLSRELGKEIKPVLYGALRHSFITASRSKGGRIVKPLNFGVSLEDIMDAVGHRSTRTTSIYDGTEIPQMIVVPMSLVHPDDP